MKALVAVDLSDGPGPVRKVADSAIAVVDAASAMAAPLGAVLDVAWAAERVAPGWIMDPAVRALLKREADEADRHETAILAELVKRVPERVRGQGRLLAGTPASALIEASKAYDLLFVASRGRKGLERLWLGSVANEVVQKAHCTVVALRHH